MHNVNIFFALFHVISHHSGFIINLHVVLENRRNFIQHRLTGLAKDNGVNMAICYKELSVYNNKFTVCLQNIGFSYKKPKFIYISDLFSLALVLIIAFGNFVNNSRTSFPW